MDIARTYNRAKTALNLVGDVTHMPFRSECMNVIKCSHVLEHLADPSLAVGEIKRVLRPYGTAQVAVPINDGFRENVLVGFLALSWHTLRTAHWLRTAGEHKWIVKQSWLLRSFSDWKVNIWFVGKIGSVCFLRSGRKGRLFRRALDYYNLPPNNWVGEWHMTALKPLRVNNSS